MSKDSTNRYKIKEQYFDYLRQTASFVDPYVKNFFEKQCLASDEIKAILLSSYRFGQPQLRPAQVRMWYEIVWWKDWWKKILPACSAVEIKDTGYYFYDDVFDKKQPLSWTMFGWLFIWLSHVVAQNLLNNFDKLTSKKVFKELLALDTNNLDWALADIALHKERNENIYSRKVEKYNFQEHALKIWAILWKGTDQQVEALWEIGENIGKAYLIANDTRDFWKELEDFRSGKYTLPIQHLFENVDNEQKNILLNYFWKEELTSEEIWFIRSLAVDSGTIEYWKKIAKALCEKWINVLAMFSQSHAKQMLEFSTTMTQRNKYYSKLHLN